MMIRRVLLVLFLAWSFITSDRRKKYNDIHKLITKLGDNQNVTYYNILNLFVDKNNNLKKNLYSLDSIHLRPKGYNIWIIRFRLYSAAEGYWYEK